MAASRSRVARRSAPSFVVVLVTVPDDACGERIANALLAKRLAACVKRVGPVHALFHWKGELDSADEQLLLVTTRADLFARVSAAVTRLHPYEVPEIVALPIEAGAAKYLRWIAAETAA